MTIRERFDAVHDEYRKFAAVENKLSQRPDLHAFLLLDRRFPEDADLVFAADHDVYYLDLSPEQIATLTDQEILDLTRCGIRYDSSAECLAVFV